MIAYFVSSRQGDLKDLFNPQDWVSGVPFMSDGLVLRDQTSQGYLYRCEIKPQQMRLVGAIPNQGLIEAFKNQGGDSLCVETILPASYLQDYVAVEQYLVFNPDIVTVLEVTPLRPTLKESLVIHSQLNSKLFDKESHLKKDVRDRLIEIGDDFVSGLKEDGVPLKVCDYWLVGSNAAYNYQPDSDVDLHIIVNMEDLDADEKILRLLYDYIKSSWSQKYNITIKGHPLEIYLEDSRTSSASNGIYSVKKDKWIKVPEPQEDRKLYPEDSDLYKDWLSRYNNLEDEEVEQFIDDLYLMRKEALAAEGEFALGNLIFKEFRNSGRLDNLKDRKNEIKSRELTLESLNESASGQTTMKTVLLVKARDKAQDLHLDMKDLDKDNCRWAIHHLDGIHDHHKAENLLLIPTGKHASLTSALKNGSKDKAKELLQSGFWIETLEVSPVSSSKAEEFWTAWVGFKEGSQDD